MLIDIELKISVTNDGSKNKTSFETPMDKTFCEAFLALEFAKDALQAQLENYLKSLPTKLNTKQFKELYNTMAIKDLAITN